MYCITSTLRYEYKRIIDKWRGIYLLVLFCYCCCFFLFCLLLLVCYCCCFFSLSFVFLSSFSAVILFLNSSSATAATTTTSSSAPVLKHHYISFFAFSFCFLFAYHLKFFHCLLFPIFILHFVRTFLSIIAPSLFFLFKQTIVLRIFPFNFNYCTHTYT